MLSKQYDWQTHHKILTNVVHFLKEHNLLPSRLSVSHDGWTEAMFSTDVSARRATAVWKRSEKRGVIEIKQPLMTVDTHTGTLLYVTFRLSEQQTRWQKITSRFTS